MSKQEVPRYYYRIASELDYNTNLYLDAYNAYKNSAYLRCNYDFFIEIKRYFIFYRKFLKDVLKFKGIKFYYPIEVFNYCKKHKLITDANTWLDFIKVINIIVSENINNTDHKIFKYIVDKFIEAPIIAYENIKNLAKQLPKFVIPEPAEWKLDKKPQYNSAEWGIGITDEMYSNILSFFKSKPNIKYVWLFGSRARSVENIRSDIDLMLNITNEELKSIYDEFNEIRIPYSIEPQSLEIYYSKPHKSKGATKLVYCRADFFEEEVVQDVPRYYFRITNKFRKKYTEFNSIYMELKKDTFTDRDVVQLFRPFKDLFQAYYQCLSDVLKYKGITCLFPDDIFYTAHEKGLIDDAVFWLDYIKALNLVVIYNNTPNLYPILHYIVSNYVQKRDKMKENLDRIISVLPKFDHVKPLPLNKNQEIVHDIDVLGKGVTNEMYNILFDYFKSKPYINKVWAFGSRIKNVARLHSDIDLAIDCPLEYKDEVENDLLELRIPYLIDPKNLYDPDCADFLSDLGTHVLIYSREDFVK